MSEARLECYNCNYFEKCYEKHCMEVNIVNFIERRMDNMLILLFVIGVILFLIKYTGQTTKQFILDNSEKKEE